MIGKGRTIKSWKDVKPGDWIWVPWPSDTWGDVEQRLQQVTKKVTGGVMVRTDSGAEMEVLNSKGCCFSLGVNEQ